MDRIQSFQTNVNDSSLYLAPSKIGGEHFVAVISISLRGYPEVAPQKTFCSFVRRDFSSARKFFGRFENFSKTRSARRRRFHQKIIEIGAILAIFELFKVLLFGKISIKKHEKNPHATFGRIQPIVPGFISKPFINRTFPGTFV